MRTTGNPLRDPRDRRLPGFAGPCGLVIFGVTGDLSVNAKPHAGGLRPGQPGAAPARRSRCVGFARRDWADQDFAKDMATRPSAGAPGPRGEASWRDWPGGSGSCPASSTTTRIRPAGRDPTTSTSQQGTGGNHAVLPVDPTGRLRRRAQAARPLRDGGQRPDRWRRVVIEKPFGHDLASAQELNELVDDVFPETQVFRIDHYLGKETVQNILALRFANQLFEPIWNAHYVDHVQITMAEDVGIGGRAGYYDGIGAARDVIQNHLLQLLALVAMEEPVSFDAD